MPPLPDDPACEKAPPPPPTPGIGFPRRTAGNAMDALTSAINENIVASRYCIFGSAALLTCYGVYHTPLFYRYSRVKDVPSYLVRKRGTIHGRIVGVVEKDGSRVDGGEEPVVCLVRHVSPMERLFRRTGSATDGPLRIEIAGVQAPPCHRAPPGTEGDDDRTRARVATDWLRAAAAHGTPVRCTLLARRVPHRPEPPPFYGHGTPHGGAGVGSDERLVGRLSYRPGGTLFRRDLATSLVRHGRAAVAAGMHVEDGNVSTSDGSGALRDREADIKYMERLADAELDAFKGKKGVWAVEQIRDSRLDLGEEVDFEANAGFFRKLWRRIRND